MSRVAGGAGGDERGRTPGGRNPVQQLIARRAGGGCGNCPRTLTGDPFTEETVLPGLAREDPDIRAFVVAVEQNE